MNQMIAADGEQVAVAGVDHDVQLGIGQLQPGGERNGAAMRGVKRIQVDVTGDASGAADAGDNRQLAPGRSWLRSARGRSELTRGADAASRTPDVRNAVHAQKLLDRICGWLQSLQLIVPPP